MKKKWRIFNMTNIAEISQKKHRQMFINNRKTFLMLRISCLLKTFFRGAVIVIINKRVTKGEFSISGR